MWDTIPDEILLLIFKYMQDYDLIKASSTCKNWRRVYEEPCLWKSRTFELRGYCRSQVKRIEMLSKYIQTMGKYLQDIHIVCRSPNLLTAYSVAACVDTLLLGLTSLKEGKKMIRTFRMSQLYFHDSWSSFRSSKCFLVDSISSFLQNQTCLRLFDMSDAYMSPPYAYRVINALVKSKSMRTLQTLHVINYYDLDIMAHNIGNQLRNVCMRSWSLKELSLNYSYLFSIRVVDICEILTETLERLNVFATLTDFSGSNWEVITTDQWKFAHSACPKLQVKFDIEGWPTDVSSILVPRIPIVQLSIKGGQCPRSNMSYSSKFSFLLDHLALHYNRTLKKASFLADGNKAAGKPLQDSLYNFLHKCKKIENLVFSENLVTMKYVTNVRETLKYENLAVSVINESHISNSTFLY